VITALVDSFVAFVFPHVQVKVEFLCQHVVLLIVDGIDVDTNTVVFVAAWKCKQNVLPFSSGQLNLIFRTNRCKVSQKNLVGVVLFSCFPQVCNKTWPSRSDFVKHPAVEINCTLCVHLLVQRAVVGVTCSRLPAAFVLACIVMSVGFDVLSKVQLLLWKQLRPDRLSEVGVRNFAILVAIKLCE
jgi:hypothetical protein